MKNKVLNGFMVALSLIVAVAGFKFILYSPDIGPASEQPAGYSFVRFESLSSSSAQNISSSSEVILAANVSRQWTYICNSSSTAASLALSATAASSSGIYLASGQCFEINSLNLYLGDISAAAHLTNANEVTLTISARE